jgi:large subunit ribosomal protein L29
MDLPVAQQELGRLRRELFTLRIQHERGEVKNNRQFQQTKKDIARLMFHINELRHAAQVEAEGVLTEAEAEPTADEENA